MKFSPYEQDQEQGIHRTLEALSNARPPEGMNDRILARLAHAEHEQGSPRLRERSSIFDMPWITYGFALAGGLALVLALALRPAHRSPARPSTASSQSEERPVSPEIPPSSIDLARRALPRAGIAASAKRPARNGQPSAPESSALRLASFPAPEAPLTEQEKLLLHIARHPGPDDFALLNPEARDQIAQASRADFNDFFPQPAPQETYYEPQQPKP